MRKLGSMSFASGCALLLALGMAAGSAPPTAAQDRSADVPWLGVMMQELTDELAEGMNYRGEGVLVSSVVPDSPAEKAGVRKGDIIVSVNNRATNSPSALSRLIRDARVGQSVTVVVVRDRARRTLTARLVARPQEPESDAWRDEVRREIHEGLKDLPGRMEFEMHRPGDGATMIFRGMGRGRLGVRAEDLSEDLAPYFNASPRAGALVMEVLQDTPAQRAGIKAGDVITQVGDRKVADADALTRAVREAPEGKVSVTVLRKGVRRSFDIELGAAPRAWRMRSGREPMVMEPRRRVTIRGDAGDRDAMREELRELRQELRELREEMERIRSRN